MTSAAHRIVTSTALVALGLLSLGGCVQSVPKAEFTCANIDWYETGRADGVQGQRYERILEHQKRCDNSPNPVAVDLYTNGRELGLTEFCTPAGGMSAGRSGLPYEGVCPDHLTKRFLTSYEVGKRIRELETEHAALEWRLNALFKDEPDLASELKARRSEIDAEITDLEGQSTRTKQSL